MWLDSLALHHGPRYRSILYTQALLRHSKLFEVCLVSTEGNLKVKSYSGLTKRGQESVQGLGCLNGDKVSCGPYMPDLYVCGFARVAHVLRHAEICIQGYTKVFNR